MCSARLVLVAALVAGTVAVPAAAEPSLPPVPTVTGLNPAQGSTVGEQRITIGGTNFTSDATVTIGSRPAKNVVVLSLTRIVATVPQHATAAGTNVRVTDHGQTSDTSARSVYRFVAPPPIGSVVSTTTVTGIGRQHDADVRPSCPVTTWCMAVGPDSAGMAVRVLAGGSWHVIAAPLPSDAYTADVGSFDNGLYGVSCAAVAQCVLIGRYVVRQGEVRHSVPLVLRYDHREWTTVPDTAFAPRTAEAVVVALSCPDVTWCRIVGAVDGVGTLFTLMPGEVTSDVITAPSDALTDPPSTFPTSIVCLTAEWCAIAGSYPGSLQIARPDFVFVTATDTVARRVLTPTNSFQRLDDLAMDCAAVGECSFVGSFVDKSGRNRPFVTTVSVSGSTSTQIAVPVKVPGAGAPYRPTPMRMSCSSSDTCVATMRFDDAAVFVQRDGRYWHVVRVPALAHFAFAFAADVSCASDDFCAAVGTAYGPDGLRGELLVRHADVWTPVDAGGPTAAIACAAVQRCAMTGNDGSSVADAVLTPPS